MKLVLLESPYAGDVETNLAYARLCLHDCLLRDEAPLASHLLYTQPGVLDDNLPAEQKLGISAGLAWRSKMDYAVFYIDLGWSSGMLAARQLYDIERLHYKLRSLNLGTLQETPDWLVP